MAKKKTEDTIQKALEKGAFYERTTGRLTRENRDLKLRNTRLFWAFVTAVVLFLSACAMMWYYYWENIVAGFKSYLTDLL